MMRTSAGAVFLTVVVDLIGFGIVLPLLPLYADKFHASGEQIGLLFSSFSAMQFLFAPLWGRISDRIGRRPVLLIGLAGSVVFYTVFGLAPAVGEGVLPGLESVDPLVLLFVARIGAGICGATIGVSNAYIADVTPREQRARGMALIGAAFGIGFTLGPPLGFFALHQGELLHEKGFAPAWVALGMPGFAAAAISLVSFLWTLTSVGEPPRHADASRRLLDLEVLRRIRAPRTLLFLLGIHFVTVFAFSFLESTLSLLLIDRFALSRQQMGSVYLFIGVTLALAQGLLARRLLARFDERTMARAGYLLMAAGMAGTAIAASPPVLLLSLALAVTGFGCVTPSVSSLISRRGDAANQGAILGLAASASALGRILGPFVGNTVYAPPEQRGTALGRSLAPLFGDLAHHQRPYALGAILLGAVALVAVIWLRPAEDEAGAGGGS